MLVGHGRVGSFISKALTQNKVPLLVIEDDPDAVDAINESGIEAISGNAASPELIAAANLGAARCLLVAIPEVFEGGQVVQQARDINPSLLIIARAHSEEEIEHLKKLGANMVVMAEHEIAKEMLEQIGSVVVPPEPVGWSMIRKSGKRFSEKIMRKKTRQTPPRPARRPRRR